MFNQAKKNNSSDNFVLSSFPSKYANRFWRGFQNWVVDLWLKRTRFKENIYYFEIEKCRADRYWVLFCKIKWLKNCSYQKMVTLKVVLIIQYSYRKITLEKSSQFFVSLNSSTFVTSAFLHLKNIKLKHPNFQYPILILYDRSHAILHHMYFSSNPFSYLHPGWRIFFPIKEILIIVVKLLQGFSCHLKS